MKKPSRGVSDKRRHLPKELSRINLNAAGIDVGASSHYAAVPEDRCERPVRKFAAYTADLYRLADWLMECPQLERFDERGDGELPATKPRKKSNRGNAPRFDVRSHLYRMTGVDLTRIDGVDGFTALKVVSEIGTDMTKWPTAKHFASWLGLSPDNKVTGGKIISSRTKANANRAAAALRMANYSLHRSDSALGAFLRRKKAQLGAPKAITATAHKLARIIYSMLRFGQDYVDAGAEYYETRYRYRALQAAKRRAAQLGYQLIPMPSGQVEAKEASPATAAGTP